MWPDPGKTVCNFKLDLIDGWVHRNLRVSRHFIKCLWRSQSHLLSVGSRVLSAGVKEISSGSQKSSFPFTLYQSVSFLRGCLKCLEKCCGVCDMVMLWVLTEKMLLAWSFSSHLRTFVLVNASTLNLFLSFTDNIGDVLVGCIWLGGSLGFHNFCNFCGNQWFLLKRLVCHNDNSFYNLCCSNARRVIIRLGTLCQALLRHGVATVQLN